MNSALLSTLDKSEKKEATQTTETSTFVEIVSLATMFLATSAVVLLLSLTWVL
ncbi:hypothetical protein [Vibrio methylphosphonaticus]|uniref:hypothetical protein n=1 Tax=Vibrio methylphosphonaticus TaxID=2946866 RepID=UPI00202A221D|nr:hypothetical protein [Vibrio methylphosphonaticus]MCL9776219.1 hypothetical protein [Vibrio methylphosphonaticus]